VFRALGTTWKRGTSWADVEVVCDNGGPPQVVVTGPTRELMDARGVNHVMLSTAHCRAFATATALALKVPGPRAAEDTALDD
jgi:holo-[acyl-carrier protein] synthase